MTDWPILDLLEEQRNRARLKLAEILIAGINDGTGMCVHKCGWSSKYAFAYMQSLQRHDLWPTHLLCLSDAMDLAEKMPDPVPDEKSCTCAYEYKHTVPEYRRNRRWSLENLKNSIGLCFRCVQSGGIDSLPCQCTD